MSWSEFIQIVKLTFNFDPSLDVPGIGVVLTAFAVNLLSWNSVDSVGSPFLTWIMTGLAMVYFAIKIRNGILTGRSIKLDNRIKAKQLEDESQH